MRFLEPFLAWFIILAIKHTFWLLSILTPGKLLHDLPHPCVAWVYKVLQEVQNAVLYKVQYAVLYAVLYKVQYAVLFKVQYAVLYAVRIAVQYAVWCTLHYLYQ